MLKARKAYMTKKKKREREEEKEREILKTVNYSKTKYKENKIWILVGSVNENSLITHCFLLQIDISKNYCLYHYLK